MNVDQEPGLRRLQRRAQILRILRTLLAGLVGAVLGAFYGLPDLHWHFGFPVGPDVMDRVFPLLAASAAAMWAWRSQLGARMVGLFALATAPMVGFVLMLGPLVLRPVPVAAMVLVPLAVAGLGLSSWWLGRSTTESKGRRSLRALRRSAMRATSGTLDGGGPPACGS